MSVKNVKIDEARANMWIREVNSEIEQVERILGEVSKAQLELPGENDTIAQNIRNTAQGVDTVWKAMCKGFHETTESIKSGIDIYARIGGEVVESIVELGKKILN